GIGGTCEGHTTYNLNHGTSMEILPWTKSKPVSTRRAEWGYSPRQKLGAMAQPFVFIDHPRGNIIIYPERLDYSWSANLQNHQAEGQDGIWPSFEAVVGEKSRRFHVGSINYIFSPDQTRRAPQRWIDALSFLSNHYCDMYGMENRRFFVHTRHLAIYQITRATWPQNYDGRTLAEQQAPWLRKMGCDAVFVDIWKYFWPEGDRDNERYVGYSVDDLEISDDFGGDKGMKEFCDIMHRNGIAVILWANFQYLAGTKMSQTDGGRGSYLLRQHPEWRLLDKEGNTRGKGLTNMSFATGWKDYLIARLKHLYEECGVDGLWVDNSAGAVGLIDYGVEPPAGMMEHYWDIVRQIQDIGMTLLFEETGGATINGSPGYVWRKSMSMDGLEWGLTKGSITGVHTQTNAQRGLLHQNAAGAQTLRRLTDADAQQAKYMRAFMRKHGGLPDRISLANLRYVRASKRWEYDNTDWVYEGVKSVPYRAVNTYQAEVLELESGAIAGDTEEATNEQDGNKSQFQSAENGKTHRIAFTAKAPVKDNPD
ncbi:MAG: hypothetical protein QF662_06740, partial [Phycisphaerae bacterium]|nr:hypothetical protein [Phycisphaerae bacterium]